MKKHAPEEGHVFCKKGIGPGIQPAQGMKKASAYGFSQRRG